MSNANYLAKGDANAICNRCGQKYKHDKDTKPEWTGLWVCHNCYDPRHPWTLPRPVVIDGLAIPNALPRPRQLDIVQLPDFDMGIVGQYYVTYVNNVGLQIAGNNLIVDNWNINVGGMNYTTFSIDQDPIGD